ncbi:MAG: chromosomal replication initiator DnaA, partial [Rhodobacteraceae bacterium]|nr:chromosomal replication initiator DnaA [Paracoccaceae bacterium]
MSAQLPLNLPPPRPALGRGDFLPAAPNALALAAIDRWAEWPQGKLVLVGPEGAGKTHLAHVWAAMRGAAVVPAASLAVADLPALAAAGAVVVEDADRIGGDAAAETALFHLHNLVLEAGGRLLLTARALPRDWGLALPDLA